MPMEVKNDSLKPGDETMKREWNWMIECIEELDGIVWEAREQGFFSIDDVEDVSNKLKNYVEEFDQPVNQKGKVLHGAVAWFMIPIFVVLLPFAWLYSFFFQR